MLMNRIRSLCEERHDVLHMEEDQPCSHPCMALEGARVEIVKVLRSGKLEGADGGFQVEFFSRAPFGSGGRREIGGTPKIAAYLLMT